MSKELEEVTIKKMVRIPLIVIHKQAGAELCQAQDKLEVIVYIGVKVGFVSTKMFI